MRSRSLLWNLSLFLTILIAVPLSWTSLAGGAELVPNGSFGAPGKNHLRPLYWSEWMDENKVKPSELAQNYLLTGGRGNSPCIELGHSYERFLQLEYDTENYARFRLDSTSMITVDPDAYYKFSVWYMTNNVTEGSQACVELDMYHGTSYIDSHIYHLAPSDAWSQFVAYFRPLRSSDRGFDDEDGNTGVDTTAMRIKLGLVSSLGSVRFDNVSMIEVPKSEYDANDPLTRFTPDPLGTRRPRAPHFNNPAKVYTVKKSGGVWWFVRPDGCAFWLRAVQNPKVLQAQNPELFANLDANFKNPGASGTNTNYRIDTLGRLGSLLFNAEAITDGQVDETVHPKGECTFFYLCPDAGSDVNKSYLLKDKDGNENDAQKPMPDPYNPDYRTWLRNYVRSNLDLLDETYSDHGVSHPDFAGYYTDNEMGVENLDEDIWSTHAAQAFIDFLKARYDNDIDKLNQTWSSKYASFALNSFDDVTTDENKYKIIRHHLDDPLAVDLNAFTKQLLKEHYKLWCTILREYECEKLGDSNGDGIADQKHLIVSNRFAFSQYPYRYDPELMRAAEAIGELVKERPGYYFDLLALNDYPGDGGFEGVVTKDNFKLVEKLSQMTGLPVFITEFGVHGRDGDLLTGNNYTENGWDPDIGWFYRQVDTLSDRGKVYDKMIRQWASSPYIVGAQWFQWCDLWQSTKGATGLPVQTEGNPYFRGRNCGLVDVNNHFYSALTNQMRATNQALNQALNQTIGGNNSARDWRDYE